MGSAAARHQCAGLAGSSGDGGAPESRQVQGLALYKGFGLAAGRADPTPMLQPWFTHRRASLQVHHPGRPSASPLQLDMR